jgi:hypothetical protein
MKVNVLEKRLLNEIFKSSEGLFVYTLYQRFKVSPGQLFQAIYNLSLLEYINSNDDRLTLTKKGVDFVSISHPNSRNARSKYEKIPVEFIGPKIEINQFYIPMLFDNSKELVHLP